MSRYFVTGIGTDIGKTIVSAALCHKLNADYFKPIQAGNLDVLEYKYVQSLVPDIHCFQTPSLLSLAASPHLAAQNDGVEINLSDFSLPNTQRNLIVEGAGGVFVPINNKETMLDLMKAFQLPVIVVIKHYLGSINHSLLSIDVLKSHQIEIKGIIFNGEPNPDSEEIILSMSRIPCLGRIPHLTEINSESLKKASQLIQL